MFQIKEIHISCFSLPIPYTLKYRETPEHKESKIKINKKSTLKNITDKVRNKREKLEGQPLTNQIMLKKRLRWF